MHIGKDLPRCGIPLLMKKNLLIVICLCLCLLFTGCGQDPDKEEPTPSPEPTAAPEVTVDPHAGMVEAGDGEGGTIWVTAAENLEEFPLDRTLFSVSDGIASYAGDGWTLRRGIDVSEHQGSIDWIAVRESGVEFAILRCGWRGYGGGSLNEDTTFRANAEAAAKAGIEVGAYFFSQATSVMEAAEEAVFAAKILSGVTLDLPVYFDWENIGVEEARTDDTDAHTVTLAALEFCRLLNTEGYRTGIYTYIPNVYYRYELDNLQGMEIWMGDPGSSPEFVYDHDIWQYSFVGSVPGIEGDVDLDVMYIPSSAEDSQG